MASLVDLTVATGLFFVFVVVILVAVIGHYTNFLGVLDNSELRMSAASVKNVLLGGKGVPADWETRGTTPLRLGLAGDLHRIPVVVTTGNETDMNNATMNFTVNFDPLCANTTRESTVRIFNQTNDEHPYTLYNKTWCTTNVFLKKADVSVNVTVPANVPKTLFVYFSPEANINLTNYGTVAFPILTNGTNYTAKAYPRETFRSLSPSKLRALRSLPFDQVVETLGTGTRFEVEVDEP